MRPAEPPLPGAAGNGPLADDELDLFFARFADTERIALAVSGGADSLALLVAIGRWRQRLKHGPKVIVLTVDHRLRKGSRAEALAVLRVARLRGMEARVLTRGGPPPTSDIEAAARIARYRLLLDATREAGAISLLLAHHRDDLAESFLMRLKRGAGVFGLAAMRPSITVGPVAIERPFLNIARERLAATTAAAGLTPVSDPMNADPRFDRVRMRRLLPVLSDEGLDPASLAAAALRLGDAADAIEGAATVLLDASIGADDLAVAWLDAAPFIAAAREIQLRALSRLLVAVGGDDYPPRHGRLVGLADAIVAHPGSGRFKRTLAGTVVEWRGGRFAFYREIGRTGLPQIAVRIGRAAVWDHRFIVAVRRGAPTGMSIGALGEAGRREIGAKAGRHPAGALAALPALRLRGRIVAVPWLLEPLAFVATARSLLFDRVRRLLLFPDLAAGG